MEELAVRTDDLIVLKQLPVIEDRLDEVYLQVQDKLQAASGLAVTEENYKEIKKTRAELNKDFGELEAVRKRVKAALEAPYKRFEGSAYKRLSDAYRQAIDKLDGEIKEVELGLKEQRQRELFDYYEEYRKSLDLSLDVADARRSGIKVGLSGSMKSLKEQARAFLDRVDGDMKMIATLDDRDEVLAEYRQSLDVTGAVRTVSDRKRRIEEERQRREEEAADKAAREAQIKAVEEAEKEAEEEALSSPSAEVAEERTDSADEQVLSCRYLGYEIYGTLTQLRGMKQVMVDAMLEYLEKEGMNYGKCE